MSTLQNLTKLIQFNKGSVSIIAAGAGKGKSKTVVEIVSKLFSTYEVLHISLEDNYKTASDRYFVESPSSIRVGKQFLKDTMNLTNPQMESRVHIHCPDKSTNIIDTIKSFIYLRNIKVVVIDHLNLYDNSNGLGELCSIIKDNNLIGIFSVQQSLKHIHEQRFYDEADNYIVVDRNEMSFKVLKGTFDNSQSSPFSDYLQDENDKLKQENEKLKNAVMERDIKIQSLQQDSRLFDHKAYQK